MAFALALLACAEVGSLAPTAAQARDAVDTIYAIDIAPGPLSASLARFSAITGISVGLSGTMPQLTTRSIRGMVSADAALRALLEGSGLRARRIGHVYRIEKQPQASPIRPPMPAAVAERPLLPLPLPDIV
ncbi:MAG: STN domain-containing protein, partial [bacterium]|nr:STN domain-containing protein [bacterium]